MGASPRSRWSNRDDASYAKKKKPPTKSWKPGIHLWGRNKGDTVAPLLLMGQFTSIAYILMLLSGVDAAGPRIEQGTFIWGKGNAALATTIAFGIASSLALFRVMISGKSPRRRRRLARLWFFAIILASYYIGFIREAQLT